MVPRQIINKHGDLPLPACFAHWTRIIANYEAGQHRVVAWDTGSRDISWICLVRVPYGSRTGSRVFNILYNLVI